MDSTSNTQEGFHEKSMVNYRIMLLIWMLNEMTVAFCAAELAHKALYIHSVVHILTVIFIGIPLVYSEICIAQYTNCTITAMWNFFPLFRSVGYGSLFLILLKTIYKWVLSALYIEYAFYAAFDPPPWFTCANFNTTSCMVKRLNVSVYERCLEAQMLNDEDCGILTASRIFFETNIGHNNTLNKPYCFFEQWKSTVAVVSIGFLIYVLSLKKQQLVVSIIRFTIVYVTMNIFMLFVVSLSTNGSWYASKVNIDWSKYTYYEVCRTMVDAFLTVGTGSGMLVYLSRDVPFRSPATMTAISVSLFSLLVTIALASMTFSGIKTMSYFHGEEQRVLEESTNTLFNLFASMTEIFNYYVYMSIWGFIYFFMIFWVIFVNVWLSITLVFEIVFGVTADVKKFSLKTFFLVLLFCALTCPFLCSDLADSLGDAIDIIQLCNSFFFSLSLYWFYGFEKHNIDIIFMIGVKSSYFWKITWVLSPIVLGIFLYNRSTKLDLTSYNDSATISGNVDLNYITYYTLMSIYGLIVSLGMLFEIIYYYRFDKLRNLFVPSSYWGPKDHVLFKSRQVFVPQIMTTEFLYRQVRIHGYGKVNRRFTKRISTMQTRLDDEYEDKLEWSALTSN